MRIRMPSDAEVSVIGCFLWSLALGVLGVGVYSWMKAGFGGGAFAANVVPALVAVAAVAALCRYVNK